MDLTSPTGRLVLTTLAAVAEMERALIVERTKAGLARVRAEGGAIGRPGALSAAQRSEVRQALAAGASVAGLAKRYGVARGTIRKEREA